MQTKIVTITPTQAALWLSRDEALGKPNRRINPDNLAKCMNAIKDEAWALNGETIKFTKDGRLLDGQHRLSACVRTNTPFTSLVVFGVDEDTFSTIDAGKKRSVADVVGILGVSENRRLLASSLTVLEAYETGKMSSSLRAFRQGTAQNAVALLNRHPGLTHVVDAVAKQKTQIMKKPSVVVGIYLAGLQDPEKANLFFNKLRDGDNLSSGDAVLILRNRLFSYQQLTKGARMNDNFVAAVVFKGINAFFAGVENNQLRHATNMEFPTLLGFIYGKPIDASKAQVMTSRGLYLAA